MVLGITNHVTGNYADDRQIVFRLCIAGSQQTALLDRAIKTANILPPQNNAPTRFSQQTFSQPVRLSTNNTAKLGHPW